MCITGGGKLRALRRACRLTQQQVATAVGVSLPTIQRWEAGTTAPKYTQAHALAQVLRVPVGELLPELLSADECNVPRLAEETRERTRQQGVLDGVAELVRRIVKAEVVPAAVMTKYLFDLAARISTIPPNLTAAAIDVITQAEAARVVGVSRQAVHRLVAEGRVKGYPNPERPDRAPMVSLAEVRSVVKPRGQSETGPTAGDGDEERSGPSG